MSASIAADQTSAAPGARLVQSLDAWLAARGDAALRAFATGALWVGGAHALYLAALPAPAEAELAGASGGAAGARGGLRGLAARRAAPRARRLAVWGVLAVAAYDALRSGQQERRRARLDERYRALLLQPAAAAPVAAGVPVPPARGRGGDAFDREPDNRARI